VKWLDIALEKSEIYFSLAQYIYGNNYHIIYFLLEEYTMHRMILVIAAIALSATAGLAQILSWQYTGSMNETRWLNNLVVLPDGTVLTAGGVDQTGQTLSSCEIFNPATASWSETSPMSTPRQTHTITALPDGRIVVTGGQITGEYDGAVETNSIEIFDPTSHTWSNGGTMMTARQSHTATLLEDSTILITGGYNSAGEFFVDSSVTPSGSNNVLASCEIYNPQTLTSHYVTPLILGRHDHSATLLGTGEVLVEGGRSGGSSSIYMNECEVYNPVNNTWRVIDPMSQPRIIGCLTTFSDGTTLASGGRNTDATCAPGSEILDPTTMMWSNTDSMKQPVHWPANVLMPFDNFLATGGLTSGELSSQIDVNGTATCEWYDKYDKVWYYAPQLNQARCKHAAVYLHQECNLSLPIELVLVAGGLTGNNTFTNSCEILDIGSSALADYKTELNPAGTMAVPQKLTAGANVSLAVLGNTGSEPVVIFSLDRNENAKVEIVNSVGNVVDEAVNTLFSQGVHDITLNTSNLQPGVYFVRLEAMSGSALGKLLVVK